jgi:hypothetical protein
MRLRERLAVVPEVPNGCEILKGKKAVSGKYSTDETLVTHLLEAYSH